MKRSQVHTGSMSIQCRDLRLTVSCSWTKTPAVLPSVLYPKPVLINLFPDNDPEELVSNFITLAALCKTTWHSN